MAIPLAKKYSNPVPLATDDEVHALLVRDPDVHQFLQEPINRYGINTDNNRYGSTYNNNQSNSTTPILTGSAATNAASDSAPLVAADETWVNTRWRPAMGWLYMVTCAFDFVIFPILWSIFQAMTHGQVTNQWQPLTLQGAGLYHLAMGAVLGIAAYGRTREKIAGTNQA